MILLILCKVKKEEPEPKSNKLTNSLTYYCFKLLLVASPLQMQWFFFGCVTLFKVLPHKLVCVRVCLSLSYCLFPLQLTETPSVRPKRLYTLHALTRSSSIFIFLLTVRRIRMFFSLKPFLTQGGSSLKISVRWGSPFWRSQGTSKHTNSLTH